MKSVKLNSIILLTLWLSVYWLLLSGFFDLFHLSLGLLSIGLVVSINFRLFHHTYYENITRDIKNIKIFRFIFYLVWLVKEIAVSALRIALLILHPKMPIKTAMIRFEAKLPSMNSKVLLGNSITLTPGTITIEIEGDGFLVHSLSSSYTKDYMDYAIAEKVASLYPSEAKKVIQNEKIMTSAEEFNG